jgi:cellulose synthase (UDP-forming)
MANIISRTLALSIVLLGIIYFVFLASHLNLKHPFFSVTFFSLHLIIFFIYILHIINTWSFKLPKSIRIKEGREKKVAVIIPTWLESPVIVERTIKSVINQDYPPNKLLIILSDDARNPEMNGMFYNLSKHYPKTNFIYNIPAAKGSLERKGEGKAGNLNSALNVIANRSDIDYVETRDADDLVTTSYFLKEMIGQLEKEKSLAFVQTIKTTLHSPKDPFGNKESLFYKVLMLAKNSSNSAFPCGSGLVWRRKALIDIGGFPEWNIVEDFQSGVEALRKGWRSLYVPVVGATSQIPPEDLPNIYKQRGIWSLDSLRFLFWDNQHGLSLKQKFQFSEPGLFYIMSVLSYILAFFPAASLVSGIQLTSFSNELIFFIVYILFILLMMLYPFSLAKKGKVKSSDVFKSLQVFYGLAPVYFWSLILALVYGPNKKPKYKVTRKFHLPGFYLIHVFPQLFLLSFLTYSIFYHLSISTEAKAMDLISIFWSVYFVLMYIRIIRLSWFNFTKLFKDNLLNLFRSLRLIKKSPPQVIFTAPHWKEG